MIQIDDPPDALACASCTSPLDWVWHARRKCWYAIARWPGDPDPTVVKIHTCRLPGVERSWRDVTFQPPEVHRRGIRKARAVVSKVNNSRKERP